ncbi:hypothetical protein LINGRAHAP2_LOCUS29847 [Linum grandiflorum]
MYIILTRVVIHHLTGRKTWAVIAHSRVLQAQPNYFPWLASSLSIIDLTILSSEFSSLNRSAFLADSPPLPLPARPLPKLKMVEAETPFRPREKLLEKQRYYQNIHKHTYLKGPMDKLTSVAIPIALAGTSLFLIGRGIYNMSHGIGKKE